MTRPTMILIAVVVVGGVAFLYFRSRSAQASTGSGAMIPMEPNPGYSNLPASAIDGVPDRVAKKRTVGAAVASTTDRLDTKKALDKAVARGTAAVTSAVKKKGAQAVAAAKNTTAGRAVSAVDTLTGGLVTAAARDAATAASARGKTAAAQALGGLKKTGGTPVHTGPSSVRSGTTIFDAATYGGSPDFTKLRAAADALEKKANTGASHF